jgi:hypothetical protein
MFWLRRRDFRLSGSAFGNVSYLERGALTDAATGMLMKYARIATVDAIETMPTVSFQSIELSRY